MTKRATHSVCWFRDGVMVISFCIFWAPRATGQPGTVDYEKSEGNDPASSAGPPDTTVAAHDALAARRMYASSPDSRDEGTAEVQPEWRPGQLAVTVGVPFYDESIINAEMTVDIRYGRKIGWFVPYFSAGFRQARLDPKQVPDEARRKKLEAWHMTLGLRVEVPASRHLFPFVGAAGELTHWGFEASTAEFCRESWYPEAWRCYERYQWKAGHALKAQIGLLYKPEPSLALEFWVERGHIVAPEMFTRPVTFISPTIGFAWHH